MVFDDRTRRSRRVLSLSAGSRIAMASIAALSLALLAWLSAALGAPWPRPLAQLVVGFFGVVTLWALGGLVRRIWREDPEYRCGRPVLLLLALSLTVRWIGITHEIGERFYLDEGTYVNRATRVNAGEFLQTRFVYPHFLYYLYAFVFWIGDLARAVVEPLARLVLGPEEGGVLNRWLARLTAAGISAFAVWPSFRIAERLAGRAAGWIGGLLIVASPVFNRDAHLLISDVPAATFAGLCLLALTALHRPDRPRSASEPLWPYAVAGVFAGLAAATKYPAGVVAVAVVAAWVARRLRTRNWHWGLVLAGAASSFTFLTAMPSLIVHWRLAWTSPQGLLFGVHQYAGGGWFGVVRQSDALYYLDELRQNWGAPLLLAGVIGLAIWWRATPERRGLLVEWLVFPVFYFALIAAMTVSVSRNVHPLLIPLAGLLGVGLTQLATKAAAAGVRRPSLARWSWLAVVLAGLAYPMVMTTLQSVALSRPGTRVLARDWIEANLEPGARLVRESYTPGFPSGRIEATEAPRRFLSNLPFAELEARCVRYVLLSEAAFGRYFREGLVAADEQPQAARAYYEAVFRDFELVREWPPSAVRDGPRLLLYRTPYASCPRGAEAATPAEKETASPEGE